MEVYSPVGIYFGLLHQVQRLGTVFVNLSVIRTSLKLFQAHVKDVFVYTVLNYAAV